MKHRLIYILLWALGLISMMLFPITIILWLFTGISLVDYFLNKAIDYESKF